MSELIGQSLLEHEPTKERFNRVDCMRHVLDTSSFSLHSIGTMGIETRYIEEADIYVNSKGKIRLKTIDATVAKQLSPFNDPNIKLTD